MKYAIREASIFPSVNNKYISLKNDPIFFGNELTCYLSGKNFNDYLKPYINDNHSERISFIKKLRSIPGGGFKDYNFDEVIKRFNIWIEGISKKITPNSMYKLAFTAVEFGEAYSDEIAEYGVFPNFIINEAGRTAEIGAPIFLTQEGLELSKLPSFAHIDFMNPVQAKAFYKVCEEKVKKDIFDQLEWLNVKQTNCHAIVEGINERIEAEIEANKKRQAHDFCITLIKWLWKNRDELAKEEDIYSTYFLNRDDEVISTEKLYSGAEVGNELGERLWGNLANKKIIVNILPLINSKEVNRSSLQKFFLMLGIEELPRKFRVSIKQPESGYIREMFSELKYPYKLERREQFKSLNDAVSRLTYLQLYVTKIDSFEDILSTADTVDIIRWIKVDEELRNILYTQHETKMCKVSILWDSKFSPRELSELNNAYSYLYYQFKKAKWIQVGDERYSIDDCIISKVFDNELAPVLVEPDISFYIKDLEGKRKALEREYTGIFEKLSVKTSFVELPLNKVYEVLITLPEKDPYGRLAKSIYRNLIEENQDYLQEELDSCDNYKLFMKSGKVYCNNGYVDINAAFYLDGRDICDKIARRFNLIVLPKRLNRSRLKQLLGVERLNLKGTMIGEPVIHEANSKFQADFRIYKPLAFCFRIDAKKALDNEARRFSNLQIILCSELKADYSLGPVELGDYEYVMDSVGTYYLKVPQGLSLVGNFELSTAVANIIGSYMDVDELASCCRELHMVGSKNIREKIIFDETGDETIVGRARAALNFTEDAKEEFIGILSDISKAEENAYGIYIDDIDFDDFSSIANVLPIIRTLKAAGIDVDDYNYQNPSMPIDLVKYYEDAILNLLPKYRESYKISRYYELMNKDNSERKSLVDLFLNYNSIHIQPRNSVWFDIDREFHKCLELIDDATPIDLNKLYQKNVKTWGRQLNNKEYVEEFLNIPENQSLIYYEEFDDLNLHYDIFVNNQNNKVQSEIVAYQIPKVVEVEIPEVSPTMIPSSGSGVHSITTTGFTKKSNARTEETGRLGEKIVYNHFLDLINQGKVQSVCWLSENAKKEKINPQGSARYGYDMEIVGEDEVRYYIEVKSAEADISQGIKFKISDFECGFAKEHPNCYHIYYVSNVRSKQPKISILKDFIVDGELNISKYAIETKTDYTVYACVKNDGEKKAK